jgi:hypothetical protein
MDTSDHPTAALDANSRLALRLVASQGGVAVLGRTIDPTWQPYLDHLVAAGHLVCDTDFETRCLIYVLP